MKSLNGLSSEEERLPDTQVVSGSNPLVRTISNENSMKKFGFHITENSYDVLYELENSEIIWLAEQQANSALTLLTGNGFKKHFSNPVKEIDIDCTLCITESMAKEQNLYDEFVFLLIKN